MFRAKKTNLHTREKKIIKKWFRVADRNFVELQSSSSQSSQAIPCLPILFITYKSFTCKKTLIFVSESKHS